MTQVAGPPAITLSRAGPQQRATLAQLFQLYIYDISRFARWPVGPDGRYDLADRLLPPYFDAADHHPYLILSQDEIAGFCLIRRASDDAARWDMGQFFVMQKFRGGATAQAAFRAALRLHPGRWQVRVLPANDPALRFWSAAIAQVNGSPVDGQDVTADGLTMRRFAFQFGPDVSPAAPPS
ncbi:GNAT family N-acetyltransferase [Thalassorhabdomicrobium marinisediminis]|uniref:GNAT family N-acetyltransferase n=1 Tax=Thalassorhabdomicrobium marinisediminis TaxID=2170577 RepID=UPI00249233D1|nr:GNAT family N-acetyltransferase [Thalassorhabdomicrobium marinisediminis]